MKGIFFDGKRAVYREDLPEPEPSREHSLIRILRANVCNTDKEILKGYRPDFKGVMGHEFVGIVEKSDEKNLIGKMVVGELNEGCGHCLYCQSGREKHCPDRKVIGMEKLDGCFAEKMVLSNHLIHEVPSGLLAEMAVYCEPLAAAMEIPAMTHIDPRQIIAVIGDGRLSYMISQIVSHEGADLTVIGKHEDKLKIFSEFAKTELTTKYDDQNFVMSDIDNNTFDTVIEASGSPSGLSLAIRLVRRQGTIILKSTFAGSSDIDMSYIVVNEITIKGSRCGPFEPALRMLEKGYITLPQVEWHELSDFEKAFSSHSFKAGFRISENY